MNGSEAWQLMLVGHMTVTTQLIHPENIHRLLYIHTRTFLMATKYLFIEVPTQRLRDFENSRFMSLEMIH